MFPLIHIYATQFRNALTLCAITIRSIAWLCRLHVIYEREREQIIQKRHIFHSAALHGWKCTMDDNHSNSFFHHGDTGSLSPPPSVLQLSHRLQPILQPFPLNTYRFAQTSARASSLSTWPKSRSNKNQQISLGCASLSETILHPFTCYSDAECSPSILAPIWCSIQTQGGVFL